MNKHVLDASAILAFAQGEPGAARIEEARPGALLSAVNHMEVVSKLMRHGLLLNDIAAFLNEAFPRVIAFDAEQSALAGKFHAAYRSFKLSYADCACLALAHSTGIPVLTGDRKWRELDCGVDVRVFR